MKERAAVEQNLQSLKQQLREYQSKLNLTTRKESQSFKALENIRPITDYLNRKRKLKVSATYLSKIWQEMTHEPFQQIFVANHYLNP